MSKLIVVGSGIKSIAHFTEETKKVIQNASKVLYLVNDELLEEWIKRESISSYSLDEFYFSSSKRVDAYQAITTFIIDEYHKADFLCVVFYGHPTVFADSALKAVKHINAVGGSAIILPAISAADCLFSDLQIDPGEQGCFSIDATELLIYERHIDIQSHLIIWQPANLGSHNHVLTHKIFLLIDYLAQYYSNEQLICVYEASAYPTQTPKRLWIHLKDLNEEHLTLISTLYVPPMPRPCPSVRYLSLLEINPDDFCLSAESHTATK